jgi:hypothetical protein
MLQPSGELWEEDTSSILKMEAASSAGTSVNILTCMCDYRRGFGLDIGFIDHFNTQPVIPLNYCAIFDLHNLKFTREQSIVFLVCYLTFPGNGF